MAVAKPTNAEASTETPKKKNKLLLIIVIGVLVLALIGAGAFFMLNKSSSHEDEDATETPHATATKKKAAHNAPPVFYKFEKPFTVKLQTTEQEAYLQTEVQLKLQGTEGQELIKQYEPELKHRMTLVLMSKTAPDLTTAAGVQRLANELRDVANLVIDPSSHKKSPAPATEPTDNADPDAPIQAVLFSTFILQ